MIKNFDYKYLKYKNKYEKLRNNQQGGDDDKIFINIQTELNSYINSSSNDDDYLPPPLYTRREDYWDFTDNINYDDITEKKIYRIHKYFFVKIGNNVYFIKLNADFNTIELHIKDIKNFVKKDVYEETPLFIDREITIN